MMYLQNGLQVNACAFNLNKYSFLKKQDNFSVI